MNSLTLDSKTCPLILFCVCFDVANHSGRIRTHKSSVVSTNGRITCAKTYHYAFPRERQGGKRRIGGWLCDTRATPANGRAEPGRQTIDICVQNGRQERHPPYSKSPFAPSHVYPLPPPPPFQPQPSPPSSSLHPSHVCPRSSLTSKPSHWLPTSQYYLHRPVRMFRSLLLSPSLFPLLNLSSLSVSRFFSFIFLAISFLSILFFLGYLFWSSPMNRLGFNPQKWRPRR